MCSPIQDIFLYSPRAVIAVNHGFIELLTLKFVLANHFFIQFQIFSRWKNLKLPNKQINSLISLMFDVWSVFQTLQEYL